MPIANNLAKDLQLIVPNLHRRYSGVTATNRMVAPRLAKMFRAAWLGSDAPNEVVREQFHLRAVFGSIRVYRRISPSVAALPRP